MPVTFRRIRVLVLGLACAPVLVSASPGAAAADDVSSTIVSAHRGGAAYAPENTLVAFRNAVRLGVDEIETDVQQTSDGVLVLLHDDTLDRTTSCTGTVSATTAAELAQCDAAWWWRPGPSLTSPSTTAVHPLRGRGIRVPTLDELLSYARSLGPRTPRLSIEIKNIPGESNFDPTGTRVAPLLVAAIERSGIPKDRFVVQSFFPASLEQVKLLDPQLTTQFLTSSGNGQTAGQNVAYTIARGHDIAAPNDTAPDLDGRLVQLAHAAGKSVLPYTPDTRAALGTVLADGVDGAITNRPACLLELLHRPVPQQLLPEEAVRAHSKPVSACEGEPARAVPAPSRPASGQATLQVRAADLTAPAPALAATGGSAAVPLVALALLAMGAASRAVHR